MVNNPSSIGTWQNSFSQRYLNSFDNVICLSLFHHSFIQLVSWLYGREGGESGRYWDDRRKGMSCSMMVSTTESKRSVDHDLISLRVEINTSDSSTDFENKFLIFSSIFSFSRMKKWRKKL